jgi:hypothetical protein
MGEQETDRRAGRTATPSWLRPVVGALRTAAGALTLVGGLTWLLLNLHGPHVLTDMTVGVVLAIGGLVLLMPHRVELPRIWSAAGAALAALAGTVIGLAASTSQLGGAFVYVTARGYPFNWLQRSGVADDAATARRLADAAHWYLDAYSLVGDLLFWGYVGLLAVVVTSLTRLALRDRAARRPA